MLVLKRRISEEILINEAWDAESPIVSFLRSMWVGGCPVSARREASAKFESDLGRSLHENPTLQAFVFFTNVDLTPTITEKLKETAASRGVAVVRHN